MYNIGHTYAGARNNEPVGLYFWFWKNHLSNSVDGKIASAGDVPVVTFMDGDELISVDRTRVNFAPATFQCYSFRYIDYNPDPRGNHSGDLAIYQDLSDPIILKEGECSFTTDWFEEMNYEHGKEYTISWFEGTRYYEISRVADSAQYTISYSSGKGYEGKRNKGGYAEYDLAVIRKELTPGLYSLNENIIVEIK